MLNRYIERIKQVYPDFAIKDYYRNDNGQNNLIIIINNSFIFRFPRYKKGIEKLKKEKKILKIAGNHLSIPTPDFIYQSFEELEVGKVFVGYDLIEGVPLWGESLKNIEDKDLRKDLAVQLTSFLLELHSISLKELEDNGLRNNDPYEGMYELYQKIKEKLFPFIRKEAQKEIADSFGQFLSHKTIKRTALIHGDFGSSNIIWEPKIGKITGVIDFGEAGAGDPAYDFAGILSSFGEDFFQMCISIYPDGNELFERVKFYRNIFALQEALHGIENDDKKAFEYGIKNFI